MLSKIIHKLRDHKRDVPLLRGRIQVFSLLYYPWLIRSIIKRDMERELRYSFAIFIITHLFNIITSMLLHSNQLYVYRSAYKRMDIASIFLISPGVATPAAVYYMKNDQFTATIVCIQWILNFMGAFGSLVFDLCCFQKEYRSIFVLLINFPNIYVLHKPLINKDYTTFMMFAMSFVCFLVGTVAYCKEIPPIIDGIFGHHEVFHLLLVIGFGLVVLGYVRAFH